MKKIFYIFGLSALIFTSCDYFEHDNYDAPDATLKGVVKDAKTNDNLSTEIAASFKIEYYELSWEEAGHSNTEAQIFWNKEDGMFNNTKIFSGKYRITLKEGAFYAPESQIVQLQSNKTTELNFSVVPYARVQIDDIQLNGTADNNNLVIKYTVQDTESEINTETTDEDLYTLSEARVFISSKSPNVGVNNNETKYTLNAKKNVSNYTPGTAKSYTETNVKNLPAGTWWIRIGVRTDNPQKRYNFTPVKEITVS
ncbi:MAG: DUF3823 domain-containing protein [Dysgonomonas sp.]